ncbi:MAG: hypothetical protein ACO1SV_01890 [Fimbriimonas sp.]
MTNDGPSTLGTSQYHDSIRRSYAMLVHVAHVLEGARRHEGEGTYLRLLGRTVASFVDQIVWADRRLVLGEYQALDSLAAEDRAHGGWIVECFHELKGEVTDLRPLPDFLRACVAYDSATGTGLAETAIGAFESLGLSLMASDRAISEDEVALLQEVIGSWRAERDALRSRDR